MRGGHSFTENTFQNNTLAIFLSGASGTFVRNNFVNNKTQFISTATGCGNGSATFSEPLPVGGNYWSTNTACVDGDTDGLCDTPFSVGTSTDNTTGKAKKIYDAFPWKQPNGWNIPAMVNKGETEDDGNQDAKGVAEYTKFTFTANLQGTTTPATLIKLFVGSGTATSSFPVASNPTNIYSITKTFKKGTYSYYFTARSGTKNLKTATKTFKTGYSNVAFLPGLEASRLYQPGILGTEDTLWEPNGNGDVRALFMNTQGVSTSSAIYTKDVIDEAYIPVGVGPNVYKSFLEQLATLKTQKIIQDWESLPYDWRLTPEEILTKGRLFPGGRLYYTGTRSGTTSPYIIQEINKLARTSDTGKVTIVAHSNGGLIAKALSDKLGTASSTLIDQMIFVAVPQAGTPQAVGAILHGFDQGIPNTFFLPNFLMSEGTARDMSQNMSSAYNLLPSNPYFTWVDDPIITFSTTSAMLAPWRTKYGTTIHSGPGLKKFMTDTLRPSFPVTDTLNQPSKANLTLYNKAVTLHATQDVWTPPKGVQLTEIAGWGVDTVRTIEYSQAIGTPECGLTVCPTVPVLIYSPKTVMDGDGTVVAPSALWTPLSSGVKKYWVNLYDYNIPVLRVIKHADILEVPEIRTLIQNVTTRNPVVPKYDYIYTNTPPNTFSDAWRLHFTLHSPLTLSLYDSKGNHTGVTSTGEIEENIPGSNYQIFGEVQYISVPADTDLQLEMKGYKKGSFTLEIEEVEGDTVVSNSRFSGIPTNEKTIVRMDIPKGKGIERASDLVIDADGNGKRKVSLKMKKNEEMVLDKEMTKMFSEEETLELPITKEEEVIE